MSEAPRAKGIPSVSRVLDDGRLVELVYDPEEKTTGFTAFNGTQHSIEREIETPSGGRLVPFSPENNLIQNNVVLLPSEPVPYGSDEKLIAEIRDFIHRYVDLSDTFELIATHYILLSWVYDVFNELPYLRLQGDYGTGKTRALFVIGSLTYKPFFASGASSVSPLFHTLNAFRGTLIFDEADFRFSDEKAELVKILNNGNVRGMPVLRTMFNHKHEFNPRAFHVFGPKIVATRGSYDDRALESRFITENMDGRKLRNDIPINLPTHFENQARELRNKLLWFRFTRRSEIGIDEGLVDRALEPRMNQVLVPLLSIIKDNETKRAINAIAHNTQSSVHLERSQSLEGRVLEILSVRIDNTKSATVPIREIVETFSDRYGDEYEKPLTNRHVGRIIRTRLRLETRKSNGVYGVPTAEAPKVEVLCKRYGIERAPQAQSGDIGTRGDVPQGLPIGQSHQT